MKRNDPPLAAIVRRRFPSASRCTLSNYSNPHRPFVPAAIFGSLTTSA